MIFKTEGTGTSPQIQAKKHLRTFLPFLFFSEKGLHARKLTIKEVFGNSVLLSWI